MRISTVALSGGLAEPALPLDKNALRQVGLMSSGIDSFPGDECIGFGQVVIAGAKLQEGGVWGVPCCSSQGGYHQR